MGKFRKKDEVIDLEYTPRPWQALVHETRKRYSVWVLHRRAGKTVALIMEAVSTALRVVGHNPHVALIYPLRTQAETVAWPILEEVCRKIPGAKILKSKLEVVFPHNSAVIRCFGTHDGQYEAMRGLYFDLAAFDEFAQCDAKALPEVVRPALSDHKGDLIICGTPQGRDNFHKTWVAAGNHPDIWSRFMLKASESGIIDDEELAANRTIMDEDVYEREYECEFSASAAGAFYSNQLDQLRKDNRITRVPVISNKPVACALDVGINDATVCWFFQVIGTSVNILDCQFWHNTKMQDVIRDIRSSDYSLMFMGIPHDMGHRDQLTGLTKEQTFREMLPGVEVELLPRRPIDEGIMMVRKLFSQLYFDGDHCGDGLEYLASYVRKFSRETQQFLNVPKHDAAADYADALRYVAQLLDVMAGGDGSGNGGTIDESVMNRTFHVPKVIGSFQR